MTKFDLPVMGDTRKSFYGKARRNNPFPFFG